MPSGQWANSTRHHRLPPNWHSEIRPAILERDNWTCYLCGAPATEVDHVTPGDDHTWANLAAICNPCHRGKSAAEGVAARTAKRAKLRRKPQRHPGFID